MTAPSPGTICPYCRSGFEAEDAVQLCPACGTPHHADCFAENGGCTIFGCTAAPADDPKISITPTDFNPAPAPVSEASLYGLNTRASTSGAAAVSPAPPPMPPGSFGPPPPPRPTPLYSRTPYFGESYVRPKSRLVFILLAIFLGSFGAHNFYAGYNKKAVIQLCLTICTCFYGSPITWIWAIVEACTVTLDDDGVPLT